MLKNISQQKIIILAIILLFIVSSAWLFYVSNKYSDVNYNTDWWAVYFSDPKNQNLDFAIENHSLKNNFHWEILDGTGKIKEGDVNLSKGNKENISVDKRDASEKKIIIRVSSENEVKEIYKSL